MSTSKKPSSYAKNKSIFQKSDAVQQALQAVLRRKNLTPLQREKAELALEHFSKAGKTLQSCNFIDKRKDGKPVKRCSDAGAELQKANLRKPANKKSTFLDIFR